MPECISRVPPLNCQVRWTNFRARINDTHSNHTRMRKIKRIYRWLCNIFFGVLHGMLFFFFIGGRLYILEYKVLRHRIFELNIWKARILKNIYIYVSTKIALKPRDELPHRCRENDLNYWLHRRKRKHNFHSCIITANIWENNGK